MTIKMRYYYPAFAHREPEIVAVDVLTEKDVLDFLNSSPKRYCQFLFVSDELVIPFNLDYLDDEHFYQIGGDYIIRYCRKDEVA